MGVKLEEEFDLLVLGGGPAGTSGATAAGALGKSVALIERSALLGGAGINTGTIPSKTLRETALMLSGWKSRRLYGVDLSMRGDTTLDDFSWHANNVMSGERARTTARLDLQGVTRIHGSASFVDAHTVRIIADDGGKTLVRGEKILIATGSSPARLPGFPFDDDRVHDSDEILALREMPKKLVVIGAGVIGSEYAGTFAALGVEVHVIDGRNKLMPFLDEEIADTLTEAMVANGVKFHWKERVLGCDASQPGDVTLTLSSGSTISCDGVLICSGRQSNTAQLNLSAAGVTPAARGLITVDCNYQTAIAHIYAAGDVIGAPALAATSIEQARRAIAHAFDAPLAGEFATILPTGIYTIPEVSFAGKSEVELRAEGIQFIVGRAYYLDIPRGNIIGERNGLLKLIFHENDMKLLGIHIVGELATELLHVGLVALLSDAGAELFDRACFNYPTLGDLYKHAASDALAQHAAQLAAPL